MFKFLKLFFVFIFLCFAGQSHGNFQIVEVFPNTIDDKNLEYIVIQNISQQPQTLSGFILSDKVKDYIIESIEILESWQIQTFSRIETKLILNNSNEEVFLRDTDWELVDSVSYNTTTKWEAILFELKESILEIPNLIISDEVLISWEVIISDEVQINPPLFDYSSVPLNKGEDMMQWSSDIVVPEIVFNLQRPSYISQSWSTNIYLCDNLRDECKVNFDLRDSFSGDFPEKDYICKIDFWLWELSWQEERCNPNTVIFPAWEYEVIFRIFHEDDREVFSEKMIFVKNIWEESEKISQELVFGEESEIPIISNDYLQAQSQSGGNIIAPEVIFWLQRPSYISLTGTGDIYNCDNSRDECKVNFDLRESFAQDVSISDFECEIDFWIDGVVFGEEQKCNPNTVSFPVWTYEVNFKLRHKEFPEHISEKTIIIHHKAYISNENTQENVSDIVELKEDSIFIYRPEIIVQSWLSGQGRYFYCLKNVCKINLEYKKRHRDERCRWNFARMQQSSISTHKKCNPWYVTVSKWVYEMSLRVYEKDNEENYKKVQFYIYNKISENEADFIQEWEEKSQTIHNIWDEDVVNIWLSIWKIEIKLQWKLSKWNTLSWSVLTCSWVEKCYVNLEWVIEGWDEKKYSWTLDWDKFSQKINPKWIWVDWEGIHEIIFKVGTMQEVFHVEIAASFSSGRERIQDRVVWWKESELKIKFTQNFLPLKYDGLRISWLAPTWSKIEIYNNWEQILSWVSDEKWKYRLVSKDFLPWEYSFDTNIVLASWEEIFVEKSWEYILTGEKRANWFIVKKVSIKKKSSTSSSSTKLPPKLVVKENEIFIPEKIETLSLREKILFIAWLLFLAICMLLHMISKTSKLVLKDVFSIYVEQYCVKHKITLILP